MDDSYRDSPNAGVCCSRIVQNEGTIQFPLHVLQLLRYHGTSFSVKDFIVPWLMP